MYHKLLFNECLGLSEFNYELYNQFEYEGTIHGHTTSGVVVVLFCEMCPEYIKTVVVRDA